jgi:1-acyl-sn-glycerol-3-phosphate acyltransferase
LLVSNHLSYLDILVIGAACPAVFVAKREVKSWPVFGWLAMLAGTVFVDRNRRLRVSDSAEEIASAPNEGLLVVLFPEGTSSDGRIVRPFKSSLLEPATTQNYGVTAGLIQYAISDGDVGQEVCCWKDTTFVPHLLKLLSKAAVSASLRFNQLHGRSRDRKELAQQMHWEVLFLEAYSSFEA